MPKMLKILLRSCLEALLIVLPVMLVITGALMVYDTGIFSPQPPLPVHEYEELPDVIRLRSLGVGIYGAGPAVWSVSIYGESRASDSDLACMSNWPSLWQVSLSGPHVTGASLKYLQPCKELKYLDLCVPNLGDESLSNLAGLTNLVHLGISGAYGGRFSAKGADYIGRLNNLVELAFYETPLTDEGLAHLTGLPKLERLVLSRVKITDAGLAYLVPMTSLRHLYIRDAPITDAGFREITKLANLESLGLTSTRITARALDLVPQMRCLRELDFCDSPIKLSDAEKLKQTAPKLTVSGPGWEIKATESDTRTRGTQTDTSILEKIRQERQRRQGDKGDTKSGE